MKNNIFTVPRFELYSIGNSFVIDKEGTVRGSSAAIEQFILLDKKKNMYIYPSLTYKKAIRKIDELSCQD